MGDCMDGDREHVQDLPRRRAAPPRYCRQGALSLLAPLRISTLRNGSRTLAPQFPARSCWVPCSLPPLAPQSFILLAAFPRPLAPPPAPTPPPPPTPRMPRAIGDGERGKGAEAALGCSSLFLPLSRSLALPACSLLPPSFLPCLRRLLQALDDAKEKAGAESAPRGAPNSRETSNAHELMDRQARSARYACPACVPSAWPVRA